jgi:hypothetical protein
MRIYRWRSDSRSNAFLPRVTLHSAPLARQRHNFSRFLEESTHDFLDVGKFRKQEEISKNEGEILVF